MTYRRRRPEESLLYQAVSKRLSDFEAKLDDESRRLPEFIYRELHAFLRCGDIEHGFARIYCRSCEHNRFVAFSCKKRGFCPACGGRRMAQLAAHQVDSVLPAVPYRQWVLTFPFELHNYLSWKPRAMSDALEVFVEALRYHYRQHCLPHAPSQAQLSSASPTALKAHALRHPNDIGACTAIQRFNGALALFPHFHTLVSDGLFLSSPSDDDEESTGDHIFIPADEPTEGELTDVLIHFRHRLRHRFIARDYLKCDDEGQLSLNWRDSEGDDETRQQLRVYQASNRLRRAFGDGAGQKLLLNHGDQPPTPRFKGHFCVNYAGFGLHAATTIAADERDELERLCRYIHRPPIARQRLTLTPDGRLYYAFRRPWSNGTEGIYFEGTEFIERLAALIPPPYKNIVRYHGVFAPRSKLRSVIVGPERQARLDSEREQRAAGRSLPTSMRWILWAELMLRVFAEDVLCCPKCGSTMQNIAIIDQPEAIRSLLPYAYAEDDIQPRAPP